MSLADARAKKLTHADGGSFVIRGDMNKTLAAGERRDSVRIQSKRSYSTHLQVFDVAHMPEGKGTWPAYVRAQRERCCGADGFCSGWRARNGRMMARWVVHGVLTAADCSEARHPGRRERHRPEPYQLAHWHVPLRLRSHRSRPGLGPNCTMPDQVVRVMKG